MSSRSTWSTQRIPGLPGLHSETVSRTKQRQKQKQQTRRRTGRGDSSVNEVLASADDDLSSTPCMAHSCRLEWGAYRPSAGRQRQGIPVVPWLVGLHTLVKSRLMRSPVSKEVGSLSKVDSQTCPLVSLRMHTHVPPPR